VERGGNREGMEGRERGGRKGRGREGREEGGERKLKMCTCMILNIKYQNGS